MRLLCFFCTLLIFYPGNAQINNSASDQLPSPLDIICDAVKDRSGNLWFATSKRGVYRYDGNLFTHFNERHGLNHYAVSCIFEDNDGTLWFGTDNGVSRFKGKNGDQDEEQVFEAFTITEPIGSGNEKNPSLLRIPKQITGIFQDRAGNMWFVTMSHGVYRFDGETFTNFLSGEILLCGIEDMSGNILVGSWRQGGVYKYVPADNADGKGPGFTTFNGFNDNMIYCMYKDKAGVVWVGTRDHGLDRYDGKTIVNFSVKEGLMNTNISCITEDSKGNLWIGSDVRGIRNGWGSERGDIFYFNGRSFMNMTATVALTAKDGLVYGPRAIVEDNHGNVWIGARNGKLFRYNSGALNSEAADHSFTDFSAQVSK